MTPSLFTLDEAESIRSSWKLLTVNGKGPVGQLILHRFFNDSPEVTEIFYNINVISDEPASYSMEHLMKNELFVSHALRVANKINSIVNCLEDTDRIVEMCTALGRVHVKHNVQPQYFDMLGSAIIKVLASVLKVEVSHPTIQAWVKAYGAIAGAAKSGLISAGSR